MRFPANSGELIFCRRVLSDKKEPDLSFRLPEYVREKLTDGLVCVFPPRPCETPRYPNASLNAARVVPLRFARRFFPTHYQYSGETDVPASYTDSSTPAFLAAVFRIRTAGKCAFFLQLLFAYVYHERVEWVTHALLSLAEARYAGLA